MFCLLRMNRSLRFVLTIVLGLALADVAIPLRGSEPFWRQVAPRKRVEADANADYTLAEKNGPWLILAASFTGDQGEQDARKLVMELRGKFNLPAYYYGMTFKVGDEQVGRGVTDYGAPIKRRYQRGNQVLEHAVLVGEFPTIDDPEAQTLLDRVKTLEPECLKVQAGESTSQSLISVRQLQRSIKERLGQKGNRGPMSHAFMTRNPLLPKEYFTPRGVDPEVAKWNKDFEYSLLKCPGKYSIKVATFAGRSSFQGKDDLGGATKVRQATEDDPLVIALQNAHNLTIALRSKGWEAYEFHDRRESYVTIGSFDEMERFEDGRLKPSSREAQIIVNTFGASTPNIGFERPAYKEMGVNDKRALELEAKEQQIKQQFEEHFSKGLGDVAEGVHPKQFVGLPFDIQPTPIEAPKQSISTAYVRH
jgi:hypothetical protein